MLQDEVLRRFEARSMRLDNGVPVRSLISFACLRLIFLLIVLITFYCVSLERVCLSYVSLERVFLSHASLEIKPYITKGS